MKPMLIILLLLCAWGTGMAAQSSDGVAERDTKEINYCHDKVTWKEWSELVLKYPNDPQLKVLYSLRAGLCVMVEQGLATLDEATTIFESFRSEAIGQLDRKDQLKKLRGEGTKGRLNGQ